MLFLEAVARPLLVVHTVAAVVLVGAATHHLIWCRGYSRGQFARARGEKRFALISSCAFVLAFVLGNLLYPTYKVRVRAEFFDNPAAIAEERELRRHHDKAGRVSTESAETLGLSSASRLFDVKEHWVALGLSASLLLLALSRLSHPKDEPRTLPLYLGLSLLVCATAWCGALVGLRTVALRAVGAV